MRQIFILTLMILLLTACSTSTTPSPATVEPELPTEVVFSETPTTAFLIPDQISAPVAELTRFNGSGPAASPAFTLAEDSLVRLGWKNQGTDKFLITIHALSQPQADPVLEIPYYASEGISDYFLTAGQYELQVDSLDGTWEVWIESATIPEE